jgi:hypothetical protein
VDTGFYLSQDARHRPRCRSLEVPYSRSLGARFRAAGPMAVDAHVNQVRMPPAGFEPATRCLEGSWRCETRVHSRSLKITKILQLAGIRPEKSDCGVNSR